MSRINWFIVWCAVLGLLGMTVFVGGLVALENKQVTPAADYVDFFEGEDLEYFDAVITTPPRETIRVYKDIDGNYHIKLDSGIDVLMVDAIRYIEDGYRAENGGNK